MNTQMLDAFLVNVVQEACAMLQIYKPGTEALATEDTRVLSCARLAYGMIAGYVNRDFLLDTYSEQYYEQDTTIRIRNTPIVNVTSVQFIDNPYVEDLTDPVFGPVLTQGVDFTIRQNKSLVISLDSLSTSVGTSNRVHVAIEYTGGYAISSENSSVHVALVMQTVANYNRLPVLGVATLQGNESTSRGASGQMTLSSDPDAGSILESIKVILSPYVYYGAAESA